MRATCFNFGRIKWKRHRRVDCVYNIGGIWFSVATWVLRLLPAVPKWTHPYFFRTCWWQSGRTLFIYVFFPSRIWFFRFERIYLVPLLHFLAASDLWQQINSIIEELLFEKKWITLNQLSRILKNVMSLAISTRTY